MHALFFVLLNQEETIMNMKKLIDLLLKREELKEVPIAHIFKVVSSLFYILNNENVFYKEEV